MHTRLRGSLNALPAPMRAENCSAVQTEIIESPARLLEMEDQWRVLWRSAPGSSPFQSPDWVIPWWEHYGNGQLLSFAFRCEGTLAGFAPAYIFQTSRGAERRLVLIGTGNSDYLDVVFEPDVVDSCCRAFCRAISRRASDWDACDFQALRPESFLLRLLRTADFPGRVERHGVCSALDLLDPLFREPMLKRARQYSRQLARAHPFTIESATPETVDDFFSSLEKLHSLRWRARGLGGVLSEQADRSFHRAAVRRMARADALRLYALRVRHQAIAALYGFSHGKRTYFYLSGFDPEYAKFSPGQIVLAHAIEQATAEGQSVFDFLSGQEAYKYRWGARGQETYRLTLKSADLLNKS